MESELIKIPRTDLDLDLMLTNLLPWNVAIPANIQPNRSKAVMYVIAW